MQAHGTSGAKQREVRLSVDVTFCPLGAGGDAERYSGRRVLCYNIPQAVHSRKG